MLTDATGGRKTCDLNAAHLAAFATNIGPAFVLAHFAPLLAKGELLAVLSAKVGSIGDNRLGAVSNYRASEAALNMLLSHWPSKWRTAHPQAVLAARTQAGGFRRCRHRSL